MLQANIDDQSSSTQARFGQVRHQHDQCCKSDCMMQMYIWYLVLIFKNKYVSYNLIIIYDINNVVCLFLFVFNNK